MTIRILPHIWRGQLYWQCLIRDGVAPFYPEKADAIDYAEHVTRGIKVEIRIHNEAGELIETRTIDRTAEGAA